jgi:hypothetical protein
MTWHFVYLSFEEGPNGRSYVGKHSTEDLNDGYLGSYSDSSFAPSNRTILEYARTAEAAIAAEIRWQRVLKVVEDPQFVNRAYQTSTKFDTTGFKMPDEVKLKMGETRTGMKRSEETKEKQRKANLGRKKSPETRQKMSESHKGKILSEGTKEKMSKSRKGVRRTEETKEKIRQSKLGKKPNSEARQKMSEAKKGCTPWNKGLKKDAK